MSDRSKLSRQIAVIARKAPVVVVGTVVDGDTDVVVVGESPKASRDAIFEIGSITKTFTALLLADMVDNDEVSLMDPLSRFGIEIAPGSRSRDITLLDLATHTARLPRVPRRFRRGAFHHVSDPYRGYDETRLRRALLNLRKSGRLGERFTYSNFGFAVLGLALANATGAPYEQLINDRICAPLGLTDTSATPLGDQALLYLPGHKRRGKPVPAWDLAAFAPAGALKSSVDDMLRYVQAHLDIGDGPIAGALTAVQTAHFQIRKNRLAIGLAWLLDNRKNTPVVWHNGGAGGFSSFVGFNSRTKVGAVVLANARVGGAVTKLGHQRLTA